MGNLSKVIVTIVMVMHAYLSSIFVQQCLSKIIAAPQILYISLAKFLSFLLLLFHSSQIYKFLPPKSLKSLLSRLNTTPLEMTDLIPWLYHEGVMSTFPCNPDVQFLSWLQRCRWQWQITKVFCGILLSHLLLELWPSINQSVSTFSPQKQPSAGPIYQIWYKFFT